MHSQIYDVHLEPEPNDGGLTVTVPALPGCVTWGRDVEHALAMATEAVEGYLDVLVKHGKPIPAPESPVSPPDLIVEIPRRVPISGAFPD